MDELERAAAGFAVADLGLVIEPSALAAARRSLDESGLLLLGEVHGVQENPLVIRSLMRALGLSGLALEWHEDLTPAVRAFLAGERLADHPLLWFGDGRITAGHLAVLRECAAAGPLSLGLFDGAMSADWDWSQQDEAMARRILAAPATETGTVVVAGNAHTPTAHTGLGVPLGAHLAGQRPGVREVRIRYGGGRFYNVEPRRFRRSIGSWWRQARLHERHGSLVLGPDRSQGGGRAAAAHTMAGWAAARIAATRLSVPPTALHGTPGTIGKRPSRQPSAPLMTSSRPDDIRDAN